MKHIFSITSRHSVGCTFLDWSVHFLSGQNDFYNVKQQQFIQLSENPILQINAHAHKKNHPEGLTHTIKMHEQLCLLPATRFYSMYPITYHLETILNLLNLNITDYKKEVKETVRLSVDNDFKSIIDFNLLQGNKVVYVNVDPNFSMYINQFRTIDKFLLQAEKLTRPSSIDDIINEHNFIFFNDSEKIWNERNLTDIWDKREKDALNLNIDEYVPFKLNYDHSSLLYLNSIELWCFGERTIKKVMKFLNLDVDTSRLEQWHVIYRQWQQLQFDILDFCVNLEHIMQCIINGWYYKLPNLSYQQEVIIQHLLIYQHNLNLKTWQLKKFPSNTQQLHQLLEPNIHLLTPRT